MDSLASTEPPSGNDQTETAVNVGGKARRLAIIARDGSDRFADPYIRVRCANANGNAKPLAGEQKTKDDFSAPPGRSELVSRLAGGYQFDR